MAMRKSGGIPPLDKGVPKSSKYSHIGSSIDTGASASKVTTVSTGAMAKRRDEIFKRIRCATLARLIKERETCESVYAMVDDDGRASCGDRASVASMSSVAASRGRPGAPTVAASAASVGTVEGSVLSVCETDTTTHEDRDLVLLDLRETTDFEVCHIPTAVSYPAAKINRDQFTADLHRCKRDPSKLLVVYHWNEQQTAGSATLLVQKGWEQVHALTGGLEEFSSSYPEVLDGEMPERPDTGSTARSAASRRP